MDDVILTVSERTDVNVELLVTTTLILVRDGEISTLDITVVVVSTVLEGNTEVGTNVSLTVSMALLLNTISVLGTGVGMKLDSGIDAVTEVNVNNDIDVISALLVIVGDISILDMVELTMRLVEATKLEDDVSSVLSTIVLVIMTVGIISVVGV